MRVFRGLPNPASRTPCALTIGNFDGVHRGHRALLARVRGAADRIGVPACVMTFEPHPREFFAARAPANSGIPEAPARIANLRDKLDALGESGIDRVIVERFNARFASLSAEHFIEDVLVAGCHARWVMVGDDFRFGAQRKGGFAMLKDAGERFGFTVEAIPVVADTVTGEDGACALERVSSSAVRAALAAGDLVRAERLLGHPYFISGHVVHGNKLGRTIGFPTANILPLGQAGTRRTALSGIFVVRVHGVADPVSDAALPAVASIGMRPTVDDSGRVLLEVHLFDFARNIYGARVRIEFLHKLRDEEKYDDVATLTAEIASDAARARKYFDLPHVAIAGDVCTTSASDRIS